MDLTRIPPCAPNTGLYPVFASGPSFLSNCAVNICNDSQSGVGIKKEL